MKLISMTEFVLSHEATTDYEYQFEDEYVIEMCEANGYEFDEQGNLV